MKHERLVKLCNWFYVKATQVSHSSELDIWESGMRDESMKLVRKQRMANMKMRPIEIEVYPTGAPFLADGRHRLAVAKEMGDKTINAIIRYYDEQANVLKEEPIVLNID